MSHRGHAIVAGILATVLIVFHLDFWRGPRTEIYLGFIPEELAYRLVWIVFAWLFLLFFTHKVWRDEHE